AVAGQVRGTRRRLRLGRAAEPESAAQRVGGFCRTTAHGAWIRLSDRSGEDEFAFLAADRSAAAAIDAVPGEFIAIAHRQWCDCREQKGECGGEDQTERVVFHVAFLSVVLRGSPPHVHTETK